MRLLEVAAALEQTDADRLIVTGASQGGGITIAVAGLAGLFGVPLVAAAPDVPVPVSLPAGGGDHRRGPVRGADQLPGRLARPQPSTAYRTLSYFDGANLGRLGDGAGAVLGGV